MIFKTLSQKMAACGLLVILAIAGLSLWMHLDLLETNRQMAALLDELAESSLVDTNTGLYVKGRMEQMVEASQRFPWRPLVLFLVVVMGFAGMWLYAVRRLLPPLVQIKQRLNPTAALDVPDILSSDELEDLNLQVDGLVAEVERRSEAQNILRSLKEGMLVVSPDSTLKWVNNSICRMLGYQAEELIGRPFTDIYVKLKSVYVHGFFKRQEVSREEELFKTKEGKIIPVRFSSSFLFDANMEAIGFVCIARDISKEKEAEEELERQSKWFQVTLASIGDGVIATDNDGVITFINKTGEDMIGWSEEDALNRKVDDILSLVDEEARTPVAFPKIKELMSGLSTRKLSQKILIRKDGTELSVDESIAPIISENGTLNGAVMVLHDTTERRHAANELRQAKEKAEAAALTKSQFLANMSHEIRTPMNGIIGMVGLLQESSLSEEQREYSEIIRKSGEALLFLINDILDFSKIEAGKLELEYSAFNLHGCLEEVGDLLAQKAQEKGLELVLLIEHDVPIKVMGDQGRLRQILLNLVTNAVKFTKRGEVLIRVGCKTQGNGRLTLQFDVKDTGIGIKPDRIDRLFKSFSQVDATTTREFGGTGLGLSICKQLVEAMAGQIWVESEYQQGSTFTFTANFGKIEGDGKTNHLAGPPELRGLRVLIASGSRTLVYALGQMLQTRGCLVEEAADSHQTLDLLLKADKGHDSFDLAIIDFNLPELVSAGLVTIIRTKLEKRSPILLLANIAGRGLVSKHLEQGVDGFMTRPVKTKNLLDWVSALSQGKEVHMPSPIPFKPGINNKALKKGAGHKILVVEDNVVNQKVAVQMLAKAGYSCDIAANGQEALEAYARMSYSLILMDCQMPEMDGFEATRRIRGMEKDLEDHVPIIAITANALKGDREKCLESGMDAYISKPIRKKELFDKVAEYLEGQAHS